MLKVYEVTVNGTATTMQLSAADAAARGLTDADTVEARAEAKQAPARANKARTAANKGA
ncbi:hypothetical protein IU501_23035 [Nocardia otitidiscaviarum]|uniref:hypothetical protein n=1 Tax=Nocardia otitidiscaviarum TaxID=1823 RepID=UPI001895B869|nr:hypothetical protein [Nocardia otitidiscaviarum]MBF6135870.1 hypothetical protein [Nocardia otitidiscaviarum]